MQGRAYTEVSVCGNRVTFVTIERSGTYGQATIQVSPRRLLRSHADERKEARRHIIEHVQQLRLDTPAAVCQNVADAIWAVAASM